MRTQLCVIVLTSALCASAGAMEPGYPFIGGWEWVSTEHLDTGEIETPASLGYTVQYLFSSSEQYVVYRDGQFEREGIWAMHIIWFSDCHYHFFEMDGDEVFWAWALDYEGESIRLRMRNGFICPPSGPFVEATTQMTFTYVGTVSDERLSWGRLKGSYR